MKISTEFIISYLFNVEKLHSSAQILMSSASNFTDNIFSMSNDKLSNEANANFTTKLGVTVNNYVPPIETKYTKTFTQPTKNSRTVLAAADAILAVRLFQQVAVRKPFHINSQISFVLEGMSCIIIDRKWSRFDFTGTVYVYLLKNEWVFSLYDIFCHCFNFLPDFANVMETTDRVQVTKSTV